MIKVSYNSSMYEVEENTKVKDFLNSINVDLDNILACKVFNEVKSLEYEFFKDCA